MEAFIARVRVLLGAAPTYLVAVGAVLTIIVGELAPYADVPAVEWVIRVGGVLVTVVGVATSIVRRVEPVIPAERGLLPPPPPPAG